MEKDKSLPRKNFLALGLAFVSFFTLPSFFRKPMKKASTKTVTMLTQDGKLVQIDAAVLPDKRKKAKDADIQNWIKR